MRPAVHTIHAPPFPRDLPWIGTQQLRVDKQIGRPLVIAFWDCRRAPSMRPLLALEEWHTSFAPRGARIIGVHVTAEGAPVPTDEVERGAARLGLTFPIVVDEELRIAESYGLRGLPSRYVFDQALRLVDAHFGLGAEADGRRLVEALVEHSERVLAERAAAPAPAAPAAVAEEDEACDAGAALPPARQPRLRVVPPDPSELPAARADDAPALVPVEPAESLPPSARGPYSARGVWLLLAGEGRARASAEDEWISVDGTGLYRAADHGVHATGELAVEVSEGVRCDAIQLEPGAAAPG